MKISVKEVDFAAGEYLLVDKPFGWTSFGIVKKVRGAFKIKKVGHAGTLDPNATGLLILCTGKMTKQIDNFQGMTKEYVGSLILGQTTPSFDSETEPDSEADISHLTEADLQAALPQFIGKIQQTPPAFSAVKVGGKRAYKLARAGKTPEIKPREVEIEIFELTGINWPEISFRVVCGKGTYIRSLVRDFGRTLGCGAYMSALRRTKIGEYSVDNALVVSDIQELADEYRLLHGIEGDTKNTQTEQPPSVQK